MNRVFSHIFVYFLKYLGSETDMEMESHPENANHIFFFFRTQSTNARTMEIVLDKKTPHVVITLMFTAKSEKSSLETIQNRLDYFASNSFDQRIQNDS